MKWQQLVTDIYERISQELEAALNGLTADDLNKQPYPGCNSIGSTNILAPDTVPGY